MPGPVILVTGSTDGIGKAAVTALVRQGAAVILHGRDRKKAERVKKELVRAVGRPGPEIIIADFSEMEQVQGMAEEILSRYSRLDVLLNNAGTYRTTRTLTTEGIEVTFAVNYLAPFLLTNLLLPLLRRSSPARIVTVASSAHEDVDRIDWDNLPGLPDYDPWMAYSLSKFADVTFTFALARRLDSTGITANCLHPGVTTTKILHAAFPGMVGIPPDEGAKTPLYLATSPAVAAISGEYFEGKQIVRSSALSRNRHVQERLWKIAEDLTGLSGA